MTVRDSLIDTIDTDRLRLRAPIASDLAALVAAANDWQVIEPTASLPYPYLEEHGRGFIERASRKPEQRSYAIATRNHDQFIGVIGLYFREADVVELGYWLARSHWGAGYASEAASGLLAQARAAGLTRIRARVLAANPASIRVLEKAGFHLAERTTSVIQRHLGKPLLIMEWTA